MQAGSQTTGRYVRTYLHHNQAISNDADDDAVQRLYSSSHVHALQEMMRGAASAGSSRAGAPTAGLSCNACMSTCPAMEVAVRAAQIRRTGARPAGSAGAGALAACLPFGWPDASFPKSEATG